MGQQQNLFLVDVGSEQVALLGRSIECAVLDQVAADVTAGIGRVLVLRGGAGAGKSALLSYYAQRVSGGSVISVVGMESEMELAYSGLHQLCASLLDGLAALPAPQGEALSVVFGLAEGPPPDPFLVGLATLTLLASASDRGPLTCLVDDGQWLDTATIQVLGFVARRLLAEPVAIVYATRPALPGGIDMLAGLPELDISELRNGDARALLMSGLHGPLDAEIVTQILAESQGNPLALLELPRTWSTADLAGGFGLPARHQVVTRIEQSYLQRLEQLPVDTQLLALTAAAEPLGDPLLLSRAVDALGIDLDAIAAATDAGLLQIRDRVRFAHPLVRSAVYAAAPAVQRHEVHSALAGATDPNTDPDRRAWHLARATPGWDEDVAAELERCAGRAQARGGIAAAAAFLDRAAQLTPDPTIRGRRALDAALTNVRIGSFDRVRQLLQIVERGPMDAMQQARVDLLNGQLALMSSRGNEGTPLLLAAAQQLVRLDLALARETFLDTFTAALFGARLNQAVSVRDVSVAAHACRQRPDEPPTTAGVLLDAFCAVAEGYETALSQCRGTLGVLTAQRESLSRESLRWLWHGTVLAFEVWDDTTANYLSEAHVTTARDIGALSELVLGLSSRTPVLVFRGELAPAASAVEEAAWLEEATGVRGAPYGALLYDAWRAHQPQHTKNLIQATIADATTRGEGIGITVSEYAHALLCNSLGQYDEALMAATRATADDTEWVAYNWALPELVEAAMRAGKPEVAADALDRLARKARAAGTDWALGMEARSRALVADGDESLFRAALDHLGRTSVRSELARTHLLLGEWLRRRNQRGAARVELGAAEQMFSAMGMDAFVVRARHELLATGAVVRKRQVDTQGDLTAQEMHVARLARDGLSNPEIAAHLFISARTVEWHLRKVFLKLGVSSRRQLQGVLSEHGAIRLRQDVAAT